MSILMLFLPHKDLLVLHGLLKHQHQLSFTWEMT